MAFHHVCTTSIHHLDDDSMLTIFDQFVDLFDLIKLERVCKRWNGLMGRFWRQLSTLHSYQKYEDMRASQQITVKVSKLVAIATKCPNIRRLDLRNVVLDISLEGAQCLTNVCPLVEELNLENSFVNFIIFGWFTHNFTGLKKISFGGLNDLSHQDFEHLFFDHPELSHFECKQLLDGNCLQALCSPLTYFHVNEISNVQFAMKALIINCKESLRTLEIGLADGEDEKCVISQIFSSFPNLVCLSLKITSSNTLKRLSILPYLKKLSLEISQKDVNVSTNVIEFLKPYSQLVQFRLPYHLSNETLFDQTVSILHNLRSLCCENGNFSLRSWIKLSTLKNLECLKLPSFGTMGTKIFRFIVKEMPCLKKLQFSDCSLHSWRKLLIAVRQDLREMNSTRKLIFESKEFGHLLIDRELSDDKIPKCEDSTQKTSNALHFEYIETQSISDDDFDDSHFNSTDERLDLSDYESEQELNEENELNDEEEEDVHESEDVSEEEHENYAEPNEFSESFGLEEEEEDEEDFEQCGDEEDFSISEEDSNMSEEDSNMSEEDSNMSEEDSNMSEEDSNMSEEDSNISENELENGEVLNQFDGNNELEDYLEESDGLENYDSLEDGERGLIDQGEQELTDDSDDYEEPSVIELSIDHVDQNQVEDSDEYEQFDVIDELTGHEEEEECQVYIEAEEEHWSGGYEQQDFDNYGDYEDNEEYDDYSDYDD